MNNHRLHTLLIGAFFVMLSSCYYDKEEVLYPGTDCNTSSVSFSKDVFPIIQTRCATPGCHVQGGGSSLLLENYTQIKASVSSGKFNDRVIVQQNMPPGQPLSKCQLASLKAWIEAGSPDN
jgi:hypothetical protein